MTRTLYKHWAEKALAAKLDPASNELTCARWGDLGITRQTAFNWRKNRDGAPIEARLAVAWILKHGAGR